MERKGVISIDEIKDTLDSAGLRKAPWELREMLEAADINKNGLVEKDEFEAVYRNNGLWNCTRRLASSVSEMKQMWHLLDVNADGRVTREEMLIRLSNDTAFAHIPGVQVNCVFTLGWVGSECALCCSG